MDATRVQYKDGKEEKRGNAQERGRIDAINGREKKTGYRDGCRNTHAHSRTHNGNMHMDPHALKEAMPKRHSNP